MSKLWPQCYYRNFDGSKMSANNKFQSSFYHSGKTPVNDCSQCYYHSEGQQNDEYYCPQCYYQNENEDDKNNYK